MISNARTHFAALLWLTVIVLIPIGALAQPARATVGVAFGGGSARGIAHIGVIKWFEENHIPIDVAAGTSMGGLIGGAFATGMSAAELRALIDGTDWDMMFGSSSFQFKNLRRKEDARDYPSRLEFGLRNGFTPPTSLNDGRQVDLLLAQVTAPYFALERFDDLPTPFRVVAVDLLKAEKVVLDRGPLAIALRATMSLPGIFPPVQLDGQVLVDGGVLDNVPADVVKGLGASQVIAIDVGLPQKSTVDYSIFGLIGQTIDAMMRTSTRAALASADITIAVDMAGFGSLDWRRADELIAHGYQAAESHRDELLKFRLPDAEWEAWLAKRAERRRTVLPPPSFITTTGFVKRDAAVAERELGKHLNKPLDIRLLEADLTALSGLDRYQSIDWRLTTEGERTGLLIQAREKVYAPPFLMLALIVENTTSENFKAQLAARYLAFDKVGSGSELRIDGAVGSDPSVAAALYKPIGATRFFVRGIGGANKRTFDFITNDAIIAEYQESRVGVEGDLGFNPTKVSELSGGFYGGHINDSIQAGNPLLPELGGAETVARLRWVVDQQDSEVIPSRGLRLLTTLSQTIASPEVPGASRTNKDLTQAELSLSSFYPVGARYRLFAGFAGGTSFDDHPLPTRQFTVGYPFVLDAFTPGERRGDHYAVLTLGAMRRFGRLPDFLGGPIFGGLWLENGSVFNSHQDADFNSQIGVGIVTETLVGPIFLGTSAGFDGGWRVRFGIGRVFR